MKIRRDFVTNSSSSSFIFGKPGEISGKTKEDILKDIKEYCDTIIEVVDSLDKFIESKDKNLFDFIEDYRCIWKEYTELHRSNKDYRKCLDKLIDTEQKIEQNKFYDKALKSVYDVYKDRLYISFESFKDSSEYFYLVKYENYDSCIETIKNNMYDFKERLEYTYSLEEVVSWYNWSNLDKLDGDDRKYLELDNDDYDLECDICDSKNCDECIDAYQAHREQLMSEEKTWDYSGMAFRHLGEYGIYGLWEGDIPYVVVEYLYVIARLSCNHMG